MKREPHLLGPEMKAHDLVKVVRFDEVTGELRYSSDALTQRRYRARTKADGALQVTIIRSLG